MIFLERAKMMMWFGFFSYMMKIYDYRIKFRRRKLKIKIDVF